MSENSNDIFVIAPHIQTHIQQIIKAKNENKLVVFVGAGVSVNAGVPTWGALVDTLKAEMGVAETDTLKIPQLYYNQRGQQEYLQKIRSVLKYNQVFYKKGEIISEILDGILDLKPEHIITTNYDTLIEQAIEHKADPFSYVKEDKDFAYINSNRLLVKMHGDFEKLNMVLKEDDFLQYSANFPLIENFVKGLFSYNTVLFIGFSFTDINLKYILQRVQTILHKDSPSCYLLATGKQNNAIEIDYLKQKHIQTIHFSDISKDKDTDRGQQLVDILKTINTFEKDKIAEKLVLKIKKQYELKNKIRPEESDENIDARFALYEHLILSMKQAYEEYNEFTAIRLQLVDKMYPFRIDERSTSYKNGCFETRNEELYKFFHHEICYSEDKQTWTLGKGEKMQQKLKKYEKDVENIFTRLQWSTIYCIRYAHNHFRIPSKESIEICNCNQCCYNNLRFDKLIKNLNDSSIQILCNSNDTQNEVQMAYYHNKIGNASMAEQLLQNAAQKAWKDKKVVTYLIAKMNEKYNYWSARKEQLRKDDYKTDEKLPKIDLQIEMEKEIRKILNEVNGNDEMYKELLYIKSEKYLTDKMKEANTDIKGIKEDYDNYIRNPAYRPDGDNLYSLFTIAAQIVNYYRGNTILYDNFIEFTEVITTLSEGLIIAYAIPRVQDNDNIAIVGNFLFNTSIFYMKPSILNDIFDKYKIKNLEIDEIQVKAFVDKFSNFLNSFSEKSMCNFFSKNIAVCHQFEKSNSFAQHSNYIFSNCLIIISKLESEHINPDFIDALLRGLEYKPFGGYGNVIDTYMEAFIKKHIQQFSETQIDSLLDYYIIKDTRNYGVMKEIFESIGIKNNYKITDTDKLNTYLNSRNTHWNNNYFITTPLIDLYKIVDDELKDIVKLKVIAVLNEKFDSTLYHRAVGYEIFAYTEQPELYEKWLDDAKESLCREVLEQDYRFDYNDFQNQVGILEMDLYHTMLFIHSQNVDTTHSKIQAIAQYNDRYKWCINPIDFDYSKFEIDWIIKLSRVTSLVKKCATISFVKNAVLDAWKKDKEDNVLSSIYH